MIPQSKAAAPRNLGLDPHRPQPQRSMQGQGSFCWEGELHSFEGSSSLDQLFLNTEATSDIGSSQGEFQDATLARSLGSSGDSPQTALDKLSTSTTYSGSQELGINLFSSVTEASPTYSGAFDSAGSARSLYHRNISARRDNRHRRHPNDWLHLSNKSPSSFDMDFTMMTVSNNHLISENLLGIYHDVLEHNLSCWLIEDTCPYKMKQRRRQRHCEISFDSASPGINPDGASTSAEWGPNWSNRIYHRVRKSVV